MQSLPAKSESKDGRPVWKRGGFALILFILISAPVFQIHVIDRAMPATHSDLLPRWVGTRAALSGKDPYSVAVLREIQIAYYGRPLTPADHVRPQAFYYPATIVLLLAPVAHYSWPAARLIFLIFVSPLLFVSFWFCLASLPIVRTPTQTRAILLLAFFSWPAIWGLRLQQPTLIVAVCVFFAWAALARGQQIVPGLLLSCTLIKPQLVLPLFAFLVLWSFLHRRWRFLLSLASSTAILLYASERIVPGWFPRWTASLHAYASATALPLAILLGHWAGLVLTLLLAALCVLVVWRFRHGSHSSAEFAGALSLALGLALVLSPTDSPMIYNDILLFPGCVLLVFARPAESWTALARKLAIALLAYGYVLVVIAVSAESLLGFSDVWESLPFRSPILPVVVTAALACAAIEPLRARRATPAVPLSLVTDPPR